jgi:hypothetical protein
MSNSENLQTVRNLAEPSTGGYISRLLKSVSGSMPIVAGLAPGTREGIPGPRSIGDDPVLLEKTAHVRAKKEKMMEFFARTGLGAYQIRTMSKGEISKFVEVASANEDIKPPQMSIYGKPAPQNFVLD